MSTFDSLSENAEFKKINARRIAALSVLVGLKESIEALDVAKPSLRAFNRLETAIDEKTDAVQSDSEAVAAWFTKNGGDALNDSGFKSYRGIAVQILNDVETVREQHHDLLHSC